MEIYLDSQLYRYSLLPNLVNTKPATFCYEMFATLKMNTSSIYGAGPLNTVPLFTSVPSNVIKYST